MSSSEMHPKRGGPDDPGFDYVGDKDLKKVQRAAYEAGWWPKRTRSGIMWLAPDGVGKVLLHDTASDRRAHANAVSEFRKAGLDV